jgi:hypothetical protein
LVITFLQVLGTDEFKALFEQVFLALKKERKKICCGFCPPTSSPLLPLYTTFLLSISKNIQVNFLPLTYTYGTQCLFSSSAGTAESHGLSSSLQKTGI